MLIPLTSFHLRRTVPMVYSSRCLFHSTLKRRLEEDRERPAEYELRVGYGKCVQLWRKL